MGQDGQEDIQAFLNRFGAAGEIDDQRTAAHAGHGPRKHGVARDLQAFGPQRLGDPRRLAVNNLQGCFRGNIARGEAGAAAG